MIAFWIAGAHRNSGVAASARAGVLLLLTCATLLRPPGIHAQGLAVTYGSKGIQTISYNGTLLENVGTYSADVFHIGHLQCTDLQGNVFNGPGCSWGQNDVTSQSWNSGTQTETYNFSWGSIATRFTQSGDTLSITVTETNNASSGLILSGAQVDPLALHFPQDPVGFSGYTQFEITTTTPGISAADFGSGIVTAVLPNEAPPLYSGWTSQGNAVYTPLMSSTAPDDLPHYLPSVSSPVQPGTSFSYTLSLRFTPEGTPANVQDAYASFAATYPSQMTWTDRRAIGTVYLASSPSGNVNTPGGFPTNPRRYFNDPSVDVTTPTGLQAFQHRILAQAATNVVNAQMLNAQGVLTWDIEGEQYPQATSYVCSPDQIATVAPEMESIITDPNSVYYGRKLDDAFFATMSSAGLKIGVCLRPQVFTFGPNSTASQVTLSSNAAIIANLDSKAKYANSRWGATMFYVDSTVDQYGGTLDPAIFQQLITDLPSFLFIPEEHTPRYYAYTAAFYDFLDRGDIGTPPWIYNVYPKAFGANRINDSDPGALANAEPQITAAVKGGDILMGHVDWWQPNDPTIVQIYKAAGQGTGGKNASVISWPSPAAITYGTALSPSQLDATANVAGTFVYSPPAGTVLGAGTQTLSATFTPTNTTDFTVAAASTTLLVDQASPVVTWASPAPISQGTALSTAQLNATANVPGTFSYSPAAGTVLNAGTNTLTAIFTPSDATDYTTQSASVSLTVNGASTGVAITSPISGATVSGNITVVAQIAFGLDAAGSYLMVDGAEVGTRRVTGGPYVYPLDTTTLSNGQYTLQIWAHDTGNNTRLSAPVTVTVSNGGTSAVVITWPTPAAISYGTPLSSAQLDATANVAGTFVYSPGAGTVLNGGTRTLGVTFTPAETGLPVTSATTNLLVQPIAPQITWAAPAAINQGTPLSSAQLDATANVPGTFVYSPGSGAVLNAGNDTLNVTFTPGDTTDYSSQTASVLLVVNGSSAPPGPVAILYPSAGASVSGVINVTAQVMVPLDPAGSFLMVDGAEVGTRRVTQGPFVYALDTTTLSSGTHVLQIWAHDIGNNVDLSAPVSVNVAN